MRLTGLDAGTIKVATNELANRSKKGSLRPSTVCLRFPDKSLLDKAGITVIETNKDNNTETDMATAISLKS